MSDIPSPKPAQDDMAERQRQMQALMRGAPIQKFYANGLGLATTASDLSVIFLDQNAPVAIVTLAFPTAKTLSNELGKALADLEQKTGEKIRDVTELMKILQPKS